jgi:choline dehydrogenase
MDESKVSHYDYVVVGGGSAGCALAGRLSASGRHRVLLLEAGGSDRSPYIQVPAGLMRLKTQYYAHQDEPDPTRDGMNTTWLTGRVLGGGSSVNGLVWVRGNPADFDAWAEMGATGWDHAGVLPYFKRGETFEGGPDAYRGADGPQHVSMGRTSHVLTDAFVAAAQRAGEPFNPDYNGRSQYGVSYVQTSQRRGFRHSAAVAYLGVLRRRKNLEIVTEAAATNVVFEGTRATGVRYEHRGLVRVARVSREVVLSAGTLATPRLLMASGVGPAEHLRGHGIDVVTDAPGVGRNLQDHLMLIMMWNVDVPTLNLSITPTGFVRHGLDFALRGRGPAAAAAGHALVFSKLHDDSPWPDVENLFAPLGMIGENTDECLADTFDTVGEHQANELKLLHRPVMSVIIQLLHPKARGSVELRSPNALDPPVIKYRFLEHPEDAQDLIAGARRVREIVGSEPMRSHVVNEAFPGDSVSTEEEWAAFVRGAAWGGQHPVGTCRMGTDPEAVVDPQLKVRGVDGLRVVDASVMPIVTSGNINAVCEMIGEKAFDLIAADF